MRAGLRGACSASGYGAWTERSACGLRKERVGARARTGGSGVGRSRGAVAETVGSGTGSRKADFGTLRGQIRGDATGTWRCGWTAGSGKGASRTISTGRPGSGTFSSHGHQRRSVRSRRPNRSDRACQGGVGGRTVTGACGFGCGNWEAGGGAGGQFRSWRVSAGALAVGSGRESAARECRSPAMVRLSAKPVASADPQSEYSEPLSRPLEVRECRAAEQA